MTLSLAGCGARTRLSLPREGGDGPADPQADPGADPPGDPPADPPADEGPPLPPWYDIQNASVSRSTMDSEPSIAVNSLGEVVVGWMRFDLATSFYFVYMATAHDGRTLSAPFEIRPADRSEYLVTGDISFAAGPGATFYATWLGLKPDPAGMLYVSDMRLGTSTNGGDSFTSIVVDPEDVYLNDRPWVTVSPGGDVYLVYNEFLYDAAIGNYVPEAMVIARRPAGGSAFSFATVPAVVNQAGLWAGDGGDIDVLYEVIDATGADLYLAHSFDGGQSFDWRTRIGRTVEMSWAAQPCVPGASIERLADGTRQILYMPTGGTQVVLRSARVGVSGAVVSDLEVTRAAQISLPWLARNVADRTVAIWLTSGFGGLWGVSSAVFSGGIASSIEPVPGTASGTTGVWNSCDMPGNLWPGHYFAIEADGSEFVATWSDAHSGEEEVWFGRRRAP